MAGVAKSSIFWRPTCSDLCDSANRDPFSHLPVPDYSPAPSTSVTWSPPSCESTIKKDRSRNSGSAESRSDRASLAESEHKRANNHGDRSSALSYFQAALLDGCANHAANPDLLHNPIPPKKTACKVGPGFRGQRDRRFPNGGCVGFERRRLDEIPGILMLGKQRLDFTAQVLIPSTGFLKHCAATTLFDVQNLVENALDFVPTFRLHLPCHSFHEEAGKERLIVLAKAFDQHEVSFHAVGSGEHQSVAVSG